MQQSEQDIKVFLPSALGTKLTLGRHNASLLQSEIDFAWDVLHTDILNNA